MHILGLILNYSPVDVASARVADIQKQYSKEKLSSIGFQNKADFYLFPPLVEQTVLHSVALLDWSRQSAIGLFSNPKSFLHHFL